MSQPINYRSVTPPPKPPEERLKQVIPIKTAYVLSKMEDQLNYYKSLLEAHTVSVIGGAATAAAAGEGAVEINAQIAHLSARIDVIKSQLRAEGYNI
jgi:hypothetical protein